MNNVVNVYIYNNLGLITDFTERPTRVRDSIADGVSPECKMVQIRLALENRSKTLILKLQNVYYFLNSPSNLVSLSLLNKASIYYNNKFEALYNKISQKLFAFTQC